MRVLLNEVFGSGNFLNEIVWQRRSASANTTNRLDNVTDSILFYQKSDSFEMNEILIYDENVEEYAIRPV